MAPSSAWSSAGVRPRSGRGKVTRTEGGFFVLAYAAYLTYLVVART
ncbi:MULTISPECIES: hypothetical protein [Micromonospora]|nr:MULTISPECIES: hypothetical protein [Micromonospora]